MMTGSAWWVRPGVPWSHTWGLILSSHSFWSLSLGGKLTIFTSHQVKQLLNGRGQLWLSDQRIPRYQVVLMENSGMAVSPYEVLYPTTLLPTPKSSLPFHSCLEILDHWTKAQEGLSEDCLILRKSGTLIEAALSWMEKKLDMQ